MSSNKDTSAITKIRKEVKLTPQVISKLQEMADKNNQSLKSFMEKVLIDRVENHL